MESPKLTKFAEKVTTEQTRIAGRCPFATDLILRIEAGQKTDNPAG
jgi:hypothetical protein